MKKSQKDFAIEIAKQAGKVIKKNMKLDDQSYKADGSPVTDSDKLINELVISGVKKYFPEHDVLSEEGSSLDNKSEYVWVCDPIDGTIPFSRALPLATFSLALVKDGEPILGVVHEPFTKKTFFAEKGQGSYLNNKKIQVSNYSQAEKSMVALESFYHSTYDLLELFGILERKNIHVNKFCSYIYQATLIASGAYTAAIYAGGAAHDAAAIKIIVEEAGGKVTDIFGNEQRYDQKIKGCLASNGATHDFFLEQIKKVFK